MLFNILLAVAVIYLVSGLSDRLLGTKLWGSVIPKAGYLRLSSPVASMHGWGVAWCNITIIPKLNLDINMEKMDEYLQLKCDCPDCTRARSDDTDSG